MPLQDYSISNFKAFGPAVQTVPLKPITLVFGPNSAGKSSLLHSLFWLREGLLRGNLNVQEPLDAEGVNLGGFQQIVHRHESATMPTIGWSIPASAIESGIGGWNRMGAFFISLGFRRIVTNVGPAVLTIGNAQGDFFRAVRNPEGIWQISILDWDHPALGAVAAAGGDQSADLPQACKESPNGLFELVMPGILPERLKYRSGEKIWLFDTAVPSAFRGLFDALKESLDSALRSMSYVPPLRSLPERDFDPLRANAVWQTLAEDSGVRSRLNDWLGDNKRFKSPCRLEVIRYLREDAVQNELPNVVRSNIIRWLAKAAIDGPGDIFSEAMERWENCPNPVSFAKQCPSYWEPLVDSELEWINNNGWFGEEIEGWDDLSDEERRRRTESLVEDLYNDDSTYHYGHGDGGPFIKFLESDAKTLKIVSDYFDEAAAAEAILDKSADIGLKSRSTMLLRDIGTNTLLSFQDVGVGISQLIPVVATAIARKNSFIAIEQPEIHIHPALQADLADVFIEAALGENKNTFLLETHSEHLILRILRRIRETTEGEIGDWPDALRQACPNGISAEDVAVLYVEPGEDGARVVELTLTANGEFACDWPGGFFEERLKELGI